MSWWLVATLVGLAILITVLMRPDIFFRGLIGGEHKEVRRPIRNEDFQARLGGEPQAGPPETKKEDDHV